MKFSYGSSKRLVEIQIRDLKIWGFHSQSLIFTLTEITEKRLARSKRKKV
jgi:hypothetical protein